MDETVKMLIELTEENIRYRMAFNSLFRKMKKAREEDSNFLLHEDEIREVLIEAGVIDE